jgi:hypothetical protein
MPSLTIQTELFPASPEGDLEGCNGMPGSAVAQWLIPELTKNGYKCDEPVQEDYGWFFSVKDQDLTIGIDISFCGNPGEIEGLPEWVISVEDKPSIFMLGQWFKGNPKKASAAKILSIITASVTAESRITVLEETKR